MDSDGQGWEAISDWVTWGRVPQENDIRYER